VVALLALAAALPVLTLTAQEQVSGNLLVDGDFEAPPTWPMQDGIGEVQVAPGWRAYYLDRPPAYVELPANCERLRDADCYWMRPEFRDNAAFANRIRSGERSQKYFSYGRMHEAGLMQQVSGIPLGARVRFSIWMQAWMCYNPSACGKEGERSDQPADMHLRVGIDPLGGTDPFTGTVVWAAEQPAWDKFVLFVVETTALSDTVTVMTHSRADWPWARTNNDVYLDDASLVIVGAYTTTAVVPLTLTAAPTLDAAQLTTTRSVTGTPTLTPTATATATPFPAGVITYAVGMGDTLFSIALRHGVQITDLLQLNGFTTSTELLLGQPLVVRLVPLTPAPTALPATAAPTPSVAPRPSPTLTPTPAPTPADTPAPAQAARVRELPATALALIGTGVCVASVGLGMRLMRPKRKKRAAP
jgi:LysM repeat protein